MRCWQPSVVWSGTNYRSWEKQFEGDSWYVDHISCAVDIKSVIDTVKIVLNRLGATFGDGDIRGEVIETASVEKLLIDFS